MRKPEVKICGIKTPEILSIAGLCGARYAGFVFVPESPRFINPEQARVLARQVPAGLRVVGLFSNADDEILERTLSAAPLDMIQLHGSESPSRVAEIKSRYHLPVMKSFGISVSGDIDAIYPYLSVIDWIVFDAKAPEGASASGGNGVAFDWNILKGKSFPKPWMLSGGLTPDTLSGALSILSPDAVDVSSGVESRKGIKDEAKIRQFLTAVNG